MADLPAVSPPLRSASGDNFRLACDAFIYLEVNAHGAVERWALEGSGPTQLSRMSLAPKLIKAGDELGACGYLARRAVVPTRLDATALPRVPADSHPR